ncbi:MAG: TRAP transporter substrate-binding protein [Paracoccus denitrificans]|uniref:TRAP transporter substrate-binding protein n=1 Tax=Paracoccus denitrificans TaxID=266 RepID=A0A533IBI7_PARDE|nr:MAG: TRAP transporter substrate-binding protein [Paracoccus denitrificans]
MFMKTLCTAASALMIGAPLAGAEELKLADFQPPTHFVVEQVYNPFAEAVSSGTNGEVTIKQYMGGELGAGPADQYSRVVDGLADIAFSLPGYTASTFPKTLLTELPGVIEADTGTEKIVANTDMLADEYKRVVLLGLWNNAPNLLLMGSTPVRTMEDLAGKKIRVPSRNAGLVVEAWGGSPVSMPAPEIYNAMQTGVLDGAMIDATALSAFKLAEVTGSITQGMETSISDFFLIMNRDSFEALTEEQQKVVLDAGKQAALNGSAAWNGVAQTAIDEFAATDGKEVITLSPEEAAKFDEASAPVVASVIEAADAEGLEATAFVDALKQ